MRPSSTGSNIGAAKLSAAATRVDRCQLWLRCRTTGWNRGQTTTKKSRLTTGLRTQSSRPSKTYSSPTRQGPVPSDAKDAHRLPSVGSVCWSLEARRPHPGLETESSRPSIGASIPAPQGPLSRHTCAPPVLPQRQPEAKHSSHHSRHWPQRRAGYERHRGCQHRGSGSSHPDRWLAPRLRSYGPLEPGSHQPWFTESLDHRRLPPVVQPCLHCGVSGGVHAPALTSSLSSRGGFWGQASYSRDRAATPQPSQRSLWPTSARTKPRSSGLAWRSITSCISKRLKIITVMPAILSSPKSSSLTVSTMPKDIPVTT